MNRRILTAALATLVLFVAGCSHHKKPALIVVTLSPTPVAVAPNGTVPITATTNDSMGVNWTCQPAATCGSFNPTTTTNGTATTYTAPSSAVGVITVAATSVTASGTSTAISMEITTAGGLGGSFIFYTAGAETAAANYTLAGSVTVDPTTGLVTGGEQDFNDGITTTTAANGDAIASGVLTLDPTTGEGTLSIATVAGAIPEETLAVQFVNTNHALITQFDGNATSSGSLDMQTATTLPAGSFSFVMSGLDTSSGPVVSGGIFTNTPGTGVAGNADVNDTGAGLPTFNTAFSGTTTVEDALGRGTITIATGPANFPVNLAYYVVGPEAIRIIDIDDASFDFAVGSAFGQGPGGFSNASFGPSVVLSVSGTSMFIPEVLLGEFTPVPNAAPDVVGGTFSAGVADANEVDFLTQVSAAAIDGTYTMNSNGYGTLTITPTEVGDYSAFGIYAVDPALNVNDPNNTGTDLGGALVADMDTATVMGSGVLVPQSDPSPSDLTGNYAFGAQYVDNGPDEADFVGNGTLTPSDPTAPPPVTVAFAGADLLNDPNGVFSGGAVLGPTTGVAVTFGGTFTDDGSGLGRSTMAIPGLSVTVGDNGAATLPTVVSYQASATQIFWMENDAASTFSGQFQQQVLPIITPAPLFQRATTKGKKTQKH